MYEQKKKNILKFPSKLTSMTGSMLAKIHVRGNFYA